MLAEEDYTYELAIKEVVRWKRRQGHDLEKILGILNRMFYPKITIDRFKDQMQNNLWCDLEMKVCESCFLNATKDRFVQEKPKYKLKDEHEKPRKSVITNDRIISDLKKITLENKPKEKSALLFRSNPLLTRTQGSDQFSSPRLRTAQSKGANPQSARPINRPISENTHQGISSQDTATKTIRYDRVMNSQRCRYMFIQSWKD